MKLGIKMAVIAAVKTEFWKDFGSKPGISCWLCQLMIN